MSKGLDALKIIYDMEDLQGGRDKFWNAYRVIEKELKALEIIKKKNVFVWGFIHRIKEIKDFEYTYDYYKTHYGYFHSGYKFELLTQEEYDLLKEILDD